jgi:hypothetical protein
VHLSDQEVALMQMVYNSDDWAVVRLDPAPEAAHGPVPDGGGAPAASRGGFEIVDKRGRRDCWLQGALAERFILGAQALAARSNSQEDFDDYIAGFAGIASQPLALH